MYQSFDPELLVRNDSDPGSRLHSKQLICVITLTAKQEDIFHNCL
jgi:hypothetical protein